LQINSSNIAKSRFEQTTCTGIANTKIKCGDGLSANITVTYLLQLKYLGEACMRFCEKISHPFNKTLPNTGTIFTMARSLHIPLIPIEIHLTQNTFEITRVLINNSYRSNNNSYEV